MNRCGNCEKYEEGMTFVPSFDQHVCEGCLSADFKKCEFCEDKFHNDHLNRVETEDIHVCDPCLKDHCAECTECDKKWSKDSLSYHEDHEVCPDCSDKFLNPRDYYGPDPDQEYELRRDREMFGDDD